MEISKLLEELQRLNECLDACDVPCDCEELQIEKPIEFETQDIPQTEIKEPELAEEDVKDTVASKLLKQLADMNLEKEEPVEEAPVEEKNETIDAEAVFDLDDKIANVENELFKIRQEIDKNPENTELVQKRDKLNNVLKGLKLKRDKKMDESKMNEISDELASKVVSKRMAQYKKEGDELDKQAADVVNAQNSLNPNVREIEKEYANNLDNFFGGIKQKAHKLYRTINKRAQRLDKENEYGQYFDSLRKNESKINEISQELADKVITQRKANMDNAVNKYANSLALQRKRRQAPVQIKEPKTALNIAQAPEEEIEDDKILSTPLKNRLQKILDLGFIDVTGPKQKEKHIIMLQGEHSGRGYRIDNSGETCIASALNNFGPTSDGAYRYGKDMFRGDLADCLVWVYENAKKHLDRKFKNKNESKINEISQETVDAVKAEREKDVVKKTKEYKATGKEEDREIAKEAKDKLNKFNKLEKDWKKSKKIKESKEESKASLVAKFQEGNNTHQIVKNGGKYMIRYNVNEDKALSSYGPIDSLSVAIETLMKRCPKAEQVK